MVPVSSILLVKTPIPGWISMNISDFLKLVNLTSNLTTFALLKKF